MDSRVQNKRGKTSKKAVTSATGKAGKSPGDGEGGCTERGFREWEWRKTTGVNRWQWDQRRRKPP